MIVVCNIDIGSSWDQRDRLLAEAASQSGTEVSSFICWVSLERLSAKSTGYPLRDDAQHGVNCCELNI